MALSAAVGLASALVRVRVGDNVRWTAGVGEGDACILGQMGRPARHWHGHGQARPGQARHYAARHVSRAVPDSAAVPTQWPRHGTIMA